jgi:hypothetical protein
MFFRDRLLSPLKTWGFTTSQKKREKDVLKVAALIYQLSTRMECHIGTCVQRLFSHFLSSSGKHVREGEIELRENGFSPSGM